jgi:cell shape-determining protein MreC
LNKNLITENDGLKRELLDKNILLDENTKLKEMFGRKNPESKLVLGAILVKPNRSPYDTFILDIGESAGIKVGQKVFANSMSVGEIYEVANSSSKVKLYSTPGEKMDVVLSGSDIYMQAVGRGGGNFEITVPAGLDVQNGSEIYLPGLMPTILGIVDSSISAPNDPFQNFSPRDTEYGYRI